MGGIPVVVNYNNVGIGIYNFKVGRGTHHRYVEIKA